MDEAERLKRSWCVRPMLDERVIKIDAPPSFSRNGRQPILCFVIRAKEIVWWMGLKGLKTGILMSGQSPRAESWQKR